MLQLLSPVIPGPLWRGAGVIAAALVLTVVDVVALTLLGATDAMAWMPSSGEPQQCYLDRLLDLQLNCAITIRRRAGDRRRARGP